MTTKFIITYLIIILLIIKQNKVLKKNKSTVLLCLFFFDVTTVLLCQSLTLSRVYISYRCVYLISAGDLATRQCGKYWPVLVHIYHLYHFRSMRLYCFFFELCEIVLLRRHILIYVFLV